MVLWVVGVDCEEEIAELEVSGASLHLVGEV